VRTALLTRAAVLAESGGTTRDAHVDGNRLRRMDRFGRSGVLAGARVLSAAGVERAAPLASPDPRFGVVVGTAYGCRDAITQHERLLAGASKVEDLAPTVFAATVHNTVCGELAILFGLGGVAETLTSGRTAGLEALVLAVGRIAQGDADRILVVAAEGIDEEMRRAFARENPGRSLVESAASVLVESEEEERARGRVGARFIRSEFGFDADSQRGTSKKNDDFLEGVGAGGARAGGGAVIERLGASGLWEIAQDLEAARSASAAGVPPPHSPSQNIHQYVVRDVHGSRAAVTFEFLS
jgi:hypothetical protein